MIETILIIVVFIQMTFMAWDEFHFHRKRGLPKWERIGHPVDTLFTLIPLSVASFTPPSREALLTFLICAVISCAIITKDEFVHARECTPGEHWVHAMLFVLHPVVLITVGYAWANSIPAQDIIRSIAALIAAFLIYQLSYWNFYGARPRNPTREQRVL